MTMGKSEDKTIKSEKGSPTRKEHINIHIYPDWAAVQACYGPGIPLPPPTQNFNPVVPAGQVPHPYAWAAPQPLMQPYGVPYTTIYSHGGLYAHSAFLPGATPSSPDVPSKSPEKMDQHLAKKLKSMDRPAVPVCNDCAKVDAGASVHMATLSEEQSVDGSSDGSNGDVGVQQTLRTSGSKGMLSTAQLSSMWKETLPTASNFFEIIMLTPHVSYISFQFSFGSDTQLGCAVPEGQRIATYDIAVVSASVSEKSVRPSNCGTAMSASHVGSNAGAELPSAAWVQDERLLKRERRKQANRDSARRSRLRKQAENEALMVNYESLNAENMALKSEIKQLTEDSEKLRLDNAALKDKLNNAELEHSGEVVSDRVEPS
ncbi:common plant regulatory factor 1-like isoform X2 [Malania oleifera]|uniref:common plant regulatory factor 1-like isoform X2 n=1 Tax=Malania oleifera TaxID=397392 RepID=UPI0025AE8D31|nr:common plant regulatory factor 1-like isoform X2 [Malania oleifera]